MMLFFFLIALTGLVYLFLNTNNRALYYMKFQNYTKAQKLLWQAVENKPFDSLYRMNLAFSYFLSSQYENAIKEYHSAKELLVNLVKNEDGSLKNPKSKLVKTQLYYIKFNSAVAATMQHKINRALAFYQEALRALANSKEVKTNIELLTKQLEESRQPDQKNPAQKLKSGKNKNKSHLEPKGKTSSEKSSSKNANQAGDLSPLPSQNSLSKGQIESILKSIQDQEKNIKLQRDKQQQSPLHSNRKDW